MDYIELFWPLELNLKLRIYSEMQSSPISQMTISEHFVELYRIIKVGAFAIIICSFILSFYIDDFMSYWLKSLDLGNESLELFVYSPYDWIDIKWAILLIFSITMVSPIVSIKLRNFALPGLYPNEKKWLTLVLFFSAIIIPITIFLIWFLILPLSIDFFNQISIIDGIVVRYDAVSIISLGIGVSWVLVIGIFTVIILSLSRLFGLVEDSESRIRIRILLISFSMIFLTLPKTYEGLRIIIAFFTVYFSDIISRLMPIHE